MTPSACRTPSSKAMSSPVIERHGLAGLAFAMSERPAPSNRNGDPDLITAFAALQSLLITSPDLDRFLADVARLAAGVVPSASCGITVRHDGRPLTVASSDVRARQFDEVQYGAGHGPCLETLRSGAVIDVPDLAADRRWERYRPHALEKGVRS